MDPGSFIFQGENDQAMSILEREIEVHFSNISQIKADQTPAGKANRQVCGKVRTVFSYLFVVVKWENGRVLHFLQPSSDKFYTSDQI